MLIVLLTSSFSLVLSCSLLPQVATLPIPLSWFLGEMLFLSSFHPL